MRQAMPHLTPTVRKESAQVASEIEGMWIASTPMKRRPPLAILQQMG
jgi:hypothetical protein